MVGCFNRIVCNKYIQYSDAVHDADKVYQYSWAIICLKFDK